MRIRVIVLIILAAVSLIFGPGTGFADVIELEDGRKIVGEVISKSGSGVTIKTRSGINLNLDRDEIVTITSKTELQKKYKDRLKGIPKDSVKEHLELAWWCDKVGLDDEYRKQLEKVLEIDPDNGDARSALDRLDGKTPEPAVKKQPKPKPKKKPDVKTAPEEKPASEAKPVKAKTPEEKSAEEIAARNEEIRKKIGKGGSKKKPSGTRDALIKALDRLAANQHTDGAWRERKGAVAPGRDPVVTSCVCLAFLATGSSLDEGPYSKHLNKAVKWAMEALMDTSKDKTGVAGMNPNCNWSKENWRLSFFCMFLIEIYAKHKDKVPGLKKKIQEGITKLQNNLESSGGYGHGPGGPNNNNYVEVAMISNWALTAVGMAKKAGFKVDTSKLKTGLDYIIRCSKGGAMRYSHINPSSPCPGRNGAAMLALAMCGQKSSPTFGALASYMIKRMTEVKFGHASPSMHYLGAALGSLQHSKQTWEQYIGTHFREIIGQQQSNGSIKGILNPREGLSDSEYGPDYATAMLTLVLALDNGGLKYIGGVYSK
ncbi:MAG: prenyltransferase/squalene oxidase repeat-containing protein [Planctomycetota bacterium]|jgi:hypothetical protein